MGWPSRTYPTVFWSGWHRRPPQLLLLGEGGAGKTTISRNVALRVGQLYLRGDTDRIPLLVDLKGAEVSRLITEILYRELDRAGVALPTARLVES